LLKTTNPDSSILMNAAGTISNPGIIDTPIFREFAYSFVTTGTMMGGIAYYDNFESPEKMDYIKPFLDQKPSETHI